MLIVEQSLDLPKPSLWPMGMGRFGKNSSGDLMFRVVYAPTVFKLIFGTNGQGITGAHKRKTYGHLGNKWILEKWLTAEQSTKLTPEEYERWGPRDPQSGMMIEGPYSAQAGYYHCWTFDDDTLHGGMEGAVEKIIGMIRQGEGKSIGQIKAENAEIDRKAEKKADEERFLRVRETEPLYGVRPANFAGTPKAVNHKTQRTPVSANELQAKRRLPVKRGSVVSMRGRTVNAGI